MIIVYKTNRNWVYSGQNRGGGMTMTKKTQDEPTVSRGVMLRKIFFSTLYLSTFTFGGGYVIVSLLKKKFVDELHWIDDEEMLDLVAIAQSSPGAVAVNGAIVIGEKLAGLSGVLCAVAGAIIPPFVIISAVSAFYTAFRENFVVKALLQGTKAGVSAVVISVAFDMGKGVVKSGSLLNILIMICAFLAEEIFDVNVLLIIAGAAACGLLRTLIGGRGKK
jgi:chromate transporter